MGDESQGVTEESDTGRRKIQEKNTVCKITVLPPRLTSIFRKFTKLRLIVTSSYDLQNFRALYPRARNDEHYNFDVTHFSKIREKNKSRIYAN